MENIDSITKIAITKNKKIKMKNLFNKKFPKKNILKKQLTMMESFMLNSKQLKPVPTLIFPSYNSEEVSNNSNYIRSKNSQKHYSPFLTIIPHVSHKYLNKSTNTILTKNSSVYNQTDINSPKNVIKKKLNSQINKKVKKEVNLLDFGSKLKLFNSNEKVSKELIKQRLKQLNELYFDYDKKNDHVKMNSFSGNGPDLLKRKIYFVKGVMDYLYPKYVLNRIHFINEEKEKGFISEMKELNQRKNGKYYVTNYQNAAQISRLSKFDHGGAFSNEAIKLKGNCIKMKKSLINNRTVYKYVKDYDFK